VLRVRPLALALSLVCLCLSLSLSSAQELLNTEPKELNDRSFFDFVGKSRPVVVEFYSPSCPHCHRFVPIYEQLAMDYASVPVLIAKVDGTRYSKLTSQYQVSGYPAFRFFPAGSVQSHDFSGEPTYRSVKAFIEAGLGNRGPVGRARFQARRNPANDNQLNA